LPDVRPFFTQGGDEHGSVHTPFAGNVHRNLASDAGLSYVHRGQWLAGSWPSWSALVRVLIDNCLISCGVTGSSRRTGLTSGLTTFP
jgi:hypothetical protein